MGVNGSGDLLNYQMVQPPVRRLRIQPRTLRYAQNADILTPCILGNFLTSSLFHFLVFHFFTQKLASWPHYRHLSTIIVSSSNRSCPPWNRVTSSRMASAISAAARSLCPHSMFASR